MNFFLSLTFILCSVLSQWALAKPGIPDITTETISYEIDLPYIGENAPAFEEQTNYLRNLWDAEIDQLRGFIDSIKDKSKAQIYLKLSYFQDGAKQTKQIKISKFLGEGQGGFAFLAEVPHPKYKDQFVKKTLKISKKFFETSKLHSLREEIISLARFRSQLPHTPKAEMLTPPFAMIKDYVEGDKIIPRLANRSRSNIARLEDLSNLLRFKSEVSSLHWTGSDLQLENLFFSTGHPKGEVILFDPGFIKRKKIGEIPATFLQDEVKLSTNLQGFAEYKLMDFYLEQGMRLETAKKLVADGINKLDRAEVVKQFIGGLIDPNAQEDIFTKQFMNWLDTEDFHPAMLLGDDNQIMKQYFEETLMINIDDPASVKKLLVYDDPRLLRSYLHAYGADQLNNMPDIVHHHLWNHLEDAADVEKLFTMYEKTPQKFMQAYEKNIVLISDMLDNPGHWLPSVQRFESGLLLAGTEHYKHNPRKLLEFFSRHEKSFKKLFIDFPTVPVVIQTKEMFDKLKAPKYICNKKKSFSNSLSALTANVGM